MPEPTALTTATVAASMAVTATVVAVAPELHIGGVELGLRLDVLLAVVVATTINTWRTHA